MIGLGEGKEKKKKKNRGKKFDPKCVWGIKRSIAAVTKTASITKRNAAKTHILRRIFIPPL